MRELFDLVDARLAVEQIARWVDILSESWDVFEKP